VWRRALVALLVAATYGCASAPRQPWVLDTDGLTDPPARRLEWIRDYPEALATTLDVMRGELQLPVVQARLVFVPDDQTFEALLLAIGYPHQLARDTAGVMTAIGGHRSVLINQRRIERHNWPGRVSTLAHELTHVLQYELGGGHRGTSAQWLREGFAEWVALRVMEALDRPFMNDVTRSALVRVRSFGPSERFPPLVQLGRFPEWVRQSRGPAGEVLYDFALFAAINVINRHGVDSVLDYFSRFATRQDPEANFRDAFGETEGTFETYLRQVVWPRRGGDRSSR
jgi:hypothetical protein